MAPEAGAGLERRPRAPSPRACLYLLRVTASRHAAPQPRCLLAGAPPDNCLSRAVCCRMHPCCDAAAPGIVAACCCSPTVSKLLARPLLLTSLWKLHITQCSEASCDAAIRAGIEQMRQSLFKREGQISYDMFGGKQAISGLSGAACGRDH